MEVDTDVADSLIMLLNLANISATYPDPVNGQLDGSTYYFIHGSKISQNHPDMSKNLSALIKLCNNICDAVKEGDRQRMNELVHEVNRMTNVYRKIIPTDVHIDNIWE